MRGWTPAAIARAAGAQLLGSAPAIGTAPEWIRGPTHTTIDSRQGAAGGMFVGLPGARTHGGRFAGQALANGAWGVLTTPDHAVAAQAQARSEPGPLSPAGGDPRRVILASEDPLRSLQLLATAWRRHLDAKVIAITGSTGKTTTKDLLNAILGAHRRTVASRANYNTEIGLPLEILNSPPETQVLVLEMGMRGAGQISDLTRIAEPDVGVIVSIGPVHLELLGSIEAIAAAKAELIAGLPAGRGTAVLPADEPLLAPYVRQDLTVTTFGEQGDVTLIAEEEDHVTIDANGERIVLEVTFAQAHLRRNLLAAVAAAQAIGVSPTGRVDPVLSPGRGQRTVLPGNITVIDDCYNANPMSMQAALEDLALTAARHHATRRIAILGDMLELGPREREYHELLGEQADASGVDLLITVGPLAAAAVAHFSREAHQTADAAEAAAKAQMLKRRGDAILIKASRGVGLERVAQALAHEGAPV
ncbi:MAG: UDP-N-acetylmuramoyl-tripeptide--D-alanyl-D-alanine ligase [Solirubrobacteraceae bacterium]